MLILYSLTFIGGYLPRIITIQANWADEKPNKTSWSLLDMTSNERNEVGKIIPLSDYFLT